ncbi:hypothetical protein [Capnocytophaga canis]|uniref:hypothetical protein n=1 Tax=Capnocytophaga canis TaxID=1848903 RepID=UPI00385E8921
MKKILNLALVAVALLVVFSCGKNSDDTQTENARIVGTWKPFKREDLRDGKIVESRRIEDDGCDRLVFTDKVLISFYRGDEDNKCVSGDEEYYKIENGIIYVQKYDEVNKKYVDEYEQWYEKNVFVDDNTLELWDSDGISGAIFTYKRVK